MMRGVSTLARASVLSLTTACLVVSNVAAQEVAESGAVNYLTGDPATWPQELEATVAAPDNHRVLLENDQVRVLEVTLAPGEVEPLHFHRWPSVLHIQQAGQWIDRDAAGNVIFDSREAPEMTYPLTLWKGPEAPHSPVNLSDDVEVRLIRVELKSQPSVTPRATNFELFPQDRTLTHAEDGVVLPDGRLLVGDWEHGLVTLAADGTKRPFGDFAAADFRTKPDPLWNSPNGIAFEPDGRHVLVADITGGHIYRADTQTEQVTLIYDHPYGVNSAVRDPSGAIWFTQSTRNEAGEASEARMFAAADKPLGDGSVWRIAPEELGQTNPAAVEVVSGLDFANGIAFDAARQKLYVAEIMQSRILSFAVDPETGELGDQRILATLPTPDNIELGPDGMLWVASPFANAVYRVDPDTGDRQTIFSPTTDTNAQIVAETARRLDAGEPVLPLLTPAMWGPLPGLVTGVILAPDGTVYVSNLGDALVRLENGETGPFEANTGGEQIALKKAIADWVDIYNRNDWALLAEQFTQDAVMLPPNAPAIVGRGAIAAWEAANEEGFRIALRPDEIVVSGDRAIIRGRSCVFVPLPDGSTGVDVGKFLEVRLRQPDGRWLISHDIFNSDLAAGSELADTCPDETAKSIVRSEGAADAPAPGGASNLIPILDNRTRVILEGIRSGDVTEIMALYGPGALYSTDNATLLSKPEAVEAFWVSVAASPAYDATLEVLRIERLGPEAFVEIQKYDVFDEAGERLFGGYASLLWRKVGGRWVIAADVSN
ncbi:MAG: SMP-30/gluconolactonase/LRE family protein [Alteripontixanthobacter sp.]